MVIVWVIFLFNQKDMVFQYCLIIKLRISLIIKYIYNADIVFSYKVYNYILSLRYINEHRKYIVVANLAYTNIEGKTILSVVNVLQFPLVY